MRLSNRDTILDAAIRVVNREGITAVTFDTVAGEAGVTRGGLLYHFSSRDALIQGINQHLADKWEAALVLHAGKPYEEASEDERYEAYVRNSVHSADRAEMLFLLEFVNKPELAAPWDRIIGRWAAPEPEEIDDPFAWVRFIARLAADGLWAHGLVSNRSMPLASRMRVMESIAEMTRSASLKIEIAPEKTASKKGGDRAKKSDAAVPRRTTRKAES